MTRRRVGIGLLILPLVMIGRMPAQEVPDIPAELQETYGAFAAAMVEGGAGVYSNTRERRSDGSWKLAASILTSGSSGGTPSQRAGGFTCTQVLGFSQSMEWYAGLSMRDLREKGTRPDLSALASDAFLPGWQGRFFMGAAVENWRDPGFAGWSGAHRLAHETPALCGPDEVDRVVFSVSGTARSPDAWAAAVDSVADVIRSQFPAVRRVVMQPVVGAPGGKCTDVRAARNHPAIVEGIRRAADRGGITAGPSPKVADCDQFSDDLGHLTVEGAEHVRRTLREHYRPSTAGPDQGDLPGELLVHTTLRPPNQDIYFVERPGAEPRLMTDHPALDDNATFSPDGEWIAFVSDRGGMADESLLTDDPQPYGEIWAVPVAGGEAVRLTNDRWEDGLPRWGISGRR